MSANDIIARRVSGRLWALMVLILGVVPARFDAAAFDCSKAISPTEKRICADPWLVKVDEEMVTLYQNIIQNGKDVQGWKADQHAWLIERGHCEDDYCLHQEYQDRSVLLRATARPAQWAGHWWRVDASGANPSELVITHPTPNSFSFDLNADAGVHHRPAPQSGELTGKAIRDSSTTAHYKGTVQSDTEHCSLAFRRTLNRLIIEQDGSGTDCGAGDIVSYDGTYVTAAADPNPAPDLLLLGVVDTSAQDNTFRKLLGKDYDIMVATDNVPDQPDNLDGNGATVVGMHSGLDTCNGKWVLMYDAKGHQWAAVWDSLSNRQGIVDLRYYTNVISDKQILPKTISAEECSGETVRVRMMP